MSSAPFCTCKNTSCEIHPTNHDKGCNPCIDRNLQKDNIPRCFFQKVIENVPNDTDFTFNGFANLVTKK